MEITLTGDEFDTVYEALHRVSHPYRDEEIADVVAAEAKAWTVLQDVRHRAGLPDAPRPSEASRT